MATVVRIIPKRTSSSSISATYPRESLWSRSVSNELVITSLMTGRLGFWTSTFNTSLLDPPPIIDWVDSGDPNNPTTVVHEQASKANLKISSIDIKPTPMDYFPDTHWLKSGNDLIPRSV
tara:strand:+ start:312 stop:671 length:360 start_codon:yes stop_codon:yes gene_type:complete